MRMSSGTGAEVLDQILGALALQLRMLLERGVQVVDVRRVMLAVMNLHRLRVDVRLERGEVVRKRGQADGPCERLLRGSGDRRRRIVFSNGSGHDSILSNATFAHVFVGSGTTIRLWTSPSTRPSSTQSRWFGETRNIVEHRQPSASSVTTVRAGATSRASRLTRWISVPTAQIDPSGLALDASE